MSAVHARGSSTGRAVFMSIRESNSLAGCYWPTAICPSLHPAPSTALIHDPVRHQRIAQQPPLRGHSGIPLEPQVTDVDHLICISGLAPLTWTSPVSVDSF
jgi:hypothetical protein